MKKTAHYRHCNWLEDESLVLSTVLTAAYDEIEGPDGFAAYGIGDGLHCVVRRHDVGQRDCFFHFITHENNSHAAVVSVIDTDVDEIAPPDNTEFIESQLFLLVRGNQALFMTHNKAMRDGGVNAMLVGLVSQSFDEPETRFLLVPKFNEDELRRVFQSGIEHIELGVGSFAQTLESVAHGGRLRDDNPFHALVAFFRENDGPEDARAASEIKNKLVLKPGRNWNHRHVKRYLTGIAMTAHDELEEFAIVTKSGVRVTHDKITVKESLDVRGNSRVLEIASARDGLRAALRRLRDLNILEA